MRFAALAVALLALLAPPAAADTLEAAGLRLVPVGAFNQPVAALGAPGDDSRLFVVQKNGEIHVVRDGVSSLFLAVGGVQYDPGNEQGLLSMAFAPDYPASGRFYVYFTDATACTGTSCDVRVDEFRRATADRADPATRRMVFRVAHREAANHNGGQIAFGPDGLLYAAPGDGGGAGDPDCDAQRNDSLLGKMLRIEPLTATVPQIYAWGLRNPFRFSFDRLTGDLLLGDVGQGAQEEVDFLAAGTPPGANFGWNFYEGTAPYQANCIASTPGGYVAPALTYDNPAAAPAAVTGGVVVRDLSMAPLLGRYLYADFYAGDVRSAVIGASGASGDASTGLLVGQLAAFGEDARCRVHIASLAGPVYRLEATAPAAAPECQRAPAGAGPDPRAAPPSTGPLASLTDRTRPAISRARLSRRRFAVSAAGTPLAARAGPLRGTTVRFSLSEPATVTLRIYRRLSRGRTRWAARGRLTRRGLRAGRRSVPFSGRVGRRALTPGRYRMTLRARDGAGNVSAGRALDFRIVPRR